MDMETGIKPKNRKKKEKKEGPLLRGSFVDYNITRLLRWSPKVGNIGCRKPQLLILDHQTNKNRHYVSSGQWEKPSDGCRLCRVI